MRTFDSPEDEKEAIADWLRARQREGYAPQAVGVFVRSPEQLERARFAVQAAGMRSVQLDDGSGGVSGSVAVDTMHLAKGLEFRAVAVAACDDEVIPLQARIERVGDDADLEEVYGTERHLLYVACTRARDRLRVTDVELRRRDIRELVEGIAERPAPMMANRVLALVREIFNFGIAREFVEFNLCAQLERPGKERRRDRVLTDDEIRTL